jgi:hypothetical protein
MEIPTKEDYARQEKLMKDLLAQNRELISKLSMPYNSDDFWQWRSREWLIEKLTISKSTLRSLEKEGHFTPIYRNNKTYYHIDEIKAYMVFDGYRKEVVERKISA